MTPYLISECCILPLLSRAGSSEVDSILTRISATFFVAEREVSQNGILIRVMCLMESFERPPRSVPSDAFTIAPASSGAQSGNALEKNVDADPLVR